MEKKAFTISDFLGSTLTTFGVSTLFLTVVGSLVGDLVQEMEGYSALFRMGKEGLTYDILLEFYAVAFIIEVLKRILFSEKLFKHMMQLWRIIILLFLTFVVMFGFIAMFEWFPLTSAEGWISFFVTFAFCFGGSTAAVILKNKIENREYEILFENYKKELNSVSEKESEESYERD